MALQRTIWDTEHTEHTVLNTVQYDVLEMIVVIVTPAPYLFFFLVNN